MLKTRIIASLILKGNHVVQSIGFNRYLPIGSLKIAVENLNRFGVDEIVIIDIDATKDERTIDYKLIQEASKVSFVPISVGGGITSVEQIALILKSGADKVLLNNIFWQNPNFIEEASKIFGKQCIIVSIDTFNEKCYNYLNKNTHNKTIISAVLEAEKLGAGEILLNNVNRDGMKEGLDIPLIQSLTKKLSIPLIAQGGVGHPKHIEEALEIDDLSAVCVGNFFHFTEHSVNVAKGYLKSKKMYPIRNETHANYQNHQFEINGRVAKIDDNTLANMLFEYHEEEII